MILRPWQLTRDIRYLAHFIPILMDHYHTRICGSPSQSSYRYRIHCAPFRSSLLVFVPGAFLRMGRTAISSVHDAVLHTPLDDTQIIIRWIFETYSAEMHGREMLLIVLQAPNRLASTSASEKQAAPIAKSCCPHLLSPRAPPPIHAVARRGAVRNNRV